MGQVAVMMKAINKRIHNEFATEASIHGINVPLITTAPKETKLTEEENKQADLAMQRFKEKRMMNRVINGRK